MNKPLKSFDELGDLYTTQVLTEGKKTESDLGFNKTGKQKKDGPEAAEGFKNKVTEVKKDGSGEPEKAGKVDMGEKSKVKTASMKESTMTKKLTFDELYDRVIKEGPDNVTEPVVDDFAPAEDKPADTAPEIPADVADTAPETVDPKELFAQICDLVAKLKEFYGINDEDVDNDSVASSEEDIEDLSKESVDTEELADSKGLSLTDKKNNVGAVKVVKKKADSGDVKAEPEAKPLGDKGAALQKKDNKVGGSGAQAKAGASAFEC